MACNGSGVESINKKIVACEKCERLRKYCGEIAAEKKKMFSHWDYWGRPVPNFGVPDAQLLIVGLAPAAHGANRTGRMFTGDQSGVWLYRALHKAGFANQPHSESKDDGLVLSRCLITAVCHCAPPDNKPAPEEVRNCSPFLEETVKSLGNLKVVLSLGQIAWQNSWRVMESLGQAKKSQRISFAHGATVRLDNGIWMISSYHPSQQNTFTGKLTEQAFDSIFQRCNKILGIADS
jgi:uracil-DNA glycosylase family 4